VTPLRLAPPKRPGIAIEEGAFVAFRRELDYIYRTFRRLGASSFDIEDLAQELFIVLLRRSWKEYDPARPLRPYLFGIAFRIAAAHRRKRRREVAFGILPVDEAGPPPDELLGAKQSRELLLAALDRIPLPRRAVLIMHELDDIPVTEVAAVLSIPRFTVYSRLRKARRELRAAIRRLSPQTA
jgi:RNA polymerase sigma-70 factor (ECF subfamily)